jgi:hypothetical protein
MAEFVRERSPSRLTEQRTFFERIVTIQPRSGLCRTNMRNAPQ